MEPDADFKPNVINTVVFLLSSTMQINTFVTNYTGHPFMQSLRENSLLFKLIAVGYASIFAAAFPAAFEPITDAFELVALPTDVVASVGLPFQQCIVLLMAVDTAAVLALEQLMSMCGCSVH